MKTKKENIGESPAFPISNDCDRIGMTYEQWLIGQALKGICANPEYKDHSHIENGENAINQAGIVIQLLNEMAEKALEEAKKKLLN
jgi:hypothetical protein